MTRVERFQKILPGKVPSTWDLSNTWVFSLQNGNNLVTRPPIKILKALFTHQLSILLPKEPKCNLVDLPIMRKKLYGSYIPAIKGAIIYIYF